ncbi:hypothetical protein RCL_jg16576.t1 [Rhizophagus clarus]|uniref:Uncharacterized protein n=1 Tax=Rhizophagus clarus TaxID=94130 RepID=A0A8H3LLR0_9GLOM|nr:hypothetical protein RCL_jg16576.t1 [Rhizophagus clarus]
MIKIFVCAHPAHFRTSLLIFRTFAHEPFILFIFYVNVKESLCARTPHIEFQTLTGRRSSFPSLGSIVIHKLLFIFYPFKAAGTFRTRFVFQLFGRVNFGFSDDQHFRIFERVGIDGTRLKFDGRFLGKFARVGNSGYRWKINIDLNWIFEGLNNIKK